MGIDAIIKSIVLKYETCKVKRLTGKFSVSDRNNNWKIERKNERIFTE